MVVSTPEIVERAVGRDLGISIFWPDSDAKRSAVILLHGGGWAHGHRDDTHGYARILRARGFLAIAAKYRLIDEAPWPAQIIDVRTQFGGCGAMPVGFGLTRGGGCCCVFVRTASIDARYVPSAATAGGGLARRWR